jgi:hypothetical protein
MRAAEVTPKRVAVAKIAVNDNATFMLEGEPTAKKKQTQV